MSRLVDHYETVRDRHGYDRVTGIDWLAPFERRFVAVDGRDAVAAALDRETLVCMGVGMTGPPHLGTVGQVLTAVELQAAGVDVQFVVADLEPYHGGADWDRVHALARQYRAFALDLGFDPDRGALRTQSDARDVMATGHRLARYYQPEEWDDPGEDTDPPPTDWERAVERVYTEGESDLGDEGPTSAAADAHSAVLHGADFLHPLDAAGYDQVVVCLGIDEHGLTPWTRSFRDAAAVDGAVAGLHTRMVPGFDGPKLSKSLDTDLSFGTDPSMLRERVRDAPDGDDPATSTVFQAMCLASRDDAARLDRLAADCRAGGEAWAAARAAYADYVAGLAEQWRATAE